MDRDNTDDDNIIQESPEYSPKSDFSKAMVVKEAVQKCMESRSKEMRSGYWNIKVLPNGIQKEYKEDSRKAFISTVEALRNLLSPEIKRHKSFLAMENKVVDNFEKLKDLYSYQERQQVIGKDPKTGMDMPVWKKTGLKYMPSVDAVVTVPSSVNPQQANTGPGLWNNHVSAYWDALVIEYDELFASLNELIDSLNYFKQELTYG